ncbi:uncharacterized protein LOC112468092 [Temnothorax curvispinosus]|uniref:Uncharacterized protein LOC112468092 n=1 Tax=Temnothorax curvispinosus TaxID=300111 RepID=A0A6J1RJE0_9HYME|nr:uncharacterized protein LOC112468092 [Temnothorax curvispinosus]
MSKNAYARRKVCNRRMQEIHDLSLQAATDAAIRATFLARYSSVAKIADDFEATHLKVIQEAANFEVEDEIRASFDKMHYAVKSRYHRETGAPFGGAPAQPSGQASVVKLPKIPLPQFSGDLTLWPSFIALFNASIHNQQISAIEKYQYLLASLKGEPLNVVKNLPFSDEYYLIAYDSLVDRYRNKRRLADHHLNSIIEAKPLKAETAEALHHLLDTFTENTRALALMKFPTDSWDFILLRFLLDKLPRSLREKFESAHRAEEIPRYTQLTKFLAEHCQVLEAVAGPSSKTKSTPVSSFVTNAADCPVCKESHYVSKCSQFLKLLPRERQAKARDLRLCLNCLRSGHGMKDCPSAWACRSCGTKHHTLLHYEQSFNTTPKPEPISATPAEPDAVPAPQSEDAPIVTMTSLANRIVLLSTVRAEAIDARGNAFPVHILLDSASQANFITEGCLRKGGFCRTKHSATVLAINEARAATTRGLTSLVIRGRGRDDTRFSIEATVLSRITSPLPNDKVEVQPWKHLKGLPLADPEYFVPGGVDILLGADSFVSVLREGRRKGERGEPDAFNSVFGWVLTGAVSPSVQAAPLRSFATALESIATSVGRFWQLEEVPEDASCSDEDRRCKEIFAKTTYRDPSGRFVVSYPFVSDPPTFVGSRSIAVSRLRALKRRFKSDPEFRAGYNSFMRDYLDSGHMEVIRNPFPSDGHIYYLPHHGVYKLDSTTTKLRVVFNASSRGPDGLSINDTLLSGPKLQQDLLAILLRFRAEAIALTADVKQMFRQIWISPEQCNYQRIVWRFSESDPIFDYLLKTVTFGFSASPFLAIYCLLQLAHQYREKYPLAFAALLEALYVDDVVTSVRTVEQARALRDQLLSLLRSAGFELRKWSSSHPAALEGLDPQLCSQSMLDFESSEDQSQKILGLRWHSQSDSFGFQVNALDRECTKRTILSEVARIFDPLGFLAPLTFTAKCLSQRLWTLKLDWDDEPPMDIRRSWSRFQTELGVLSSLRVPRAFNSCHVDRCELHGFCDASELGYGAVIYLRIVTRDGVGVRLLCAKSKVAPLRPLTIPRLELCAALLLSKLIAYVRRTLRGHLDIDDEYAWTDSEVARAWIRSAPQRWKTFVRNRVALIQDNVPVSAWGHVDTESNPADHCSRGLYPRDLVANSMWWAGPEWLVRFEPRVEPSHGSETPPIGEEKIVSLVALDPPDAVHSLLERFSSIEKIGRIIAYILRFVHHFRAKSAPTTLAIDQLELHSALLLVVKSVQADAFRDEIDRLQSGRRLPKPFRKLAPFLDPVGILRVGGRLAKSGLTFENKHPALLPCKHRLTDLVIEHVHRTNMHPGRRTLQYLLTQHYWVLGVHRAIQRVLSRCHQCFRVNPHTSQPLMAELPADRVRRAKPFSISGVDFAGPFNIVTRRARGVSSVKVYACLFVCFSVKAVHLEAAFSLSTDSFLAALRRFVARRGRCSLLYSDCGTNFVGAARELESRMSLAAEREKIKWSFNPPSAPHSGASGRRESRPLKPTCGGPWVIKSSQ